LHGTNFFDREGDRRWERERERERGRREPKEFFLKYFSLKE
jgi:hypothetical protein